MLRRRVDLHAAAFARHGQRDLAFEVEVVLAAGARGSMQPVRRGADCGRGVAAHHMDRRQHVGFRRQRVVDREDRRQRRRCRSGRGARRGARRSRSVAATANIGCPANCTMSAAKIGSSCWIGPTSLTPGMSAAVTTSTTPGARAHVGRGRAPSRRPCATGLTPSATCKRAARLGQVVGVVRRARDVQCRGIVRQIRADDARSRVGGQGGRSERRVRGVHRFIRAARPGASSTRVVTGAPAGFEPEAAHQVAEHVRAIRGGRAHVVDGRELARERDLRRGRSGRVVPRAARRAALPSTWRARDRAPRRRSPSRACDDVPPTHASAQNTRTPRRCPGRSAC